MGGGTRNCVQGPPKYGKLTLPKTSPVFPYLCPRSSSHRLRPPQGSCLGHHRRAHHVFMGGKGNKASKSLFGVSAPVSCIYMCVCVYRCRHLRALVHRIEDFDQLFKSFSLAFLA